MKNSLITFTQRYQAEWQARFNHEAKSEHLYGIDSPCVIRCNDGAVFWQAVPMKRNLAIVEEVMQLVIHPSAHLFYGSQYAGDMAGQWQNQAQLLNLSLIQAWNDDDFARLEQNLIAHLSMQKKLKRRPTIFIASTEDDSHIVAIDNQTGQIVLEKLIENEMEVLSSSLDTFFHALIPIAQ